MRRCPEFAALFFLLRECSYFALQGALVYVTQVVVVDFNHRSQRALAETGDGADGELAVRRSEREFVCLAGFADFRIAQAEIEADLGQQVARAAGVAGSAAADADDVVALRIEIEERVKGGGAVDSGRRDTGLIRDIAQRLHGEKLVRVGGLDGFQYSQQGTGLVFVLCDYLVDEELFVSFKDLVDNFTGGGWHASSPPELQDRLRGEETGDKGKEHSPTTIG